jgi:hypothetical protein
MIWQIPWAWLGLGALALPLLIHLLGRGRAVRYRFPTLRFLERSTLLPTRRTRIHDVPLLIVRMAIIAIAVAALAQPLSLDAARRGALRGAPFRAIILDTSASMLRPTPSGERAIEEARREVRRLADEAPGSVVLPTDAPRRAVAGAGAWLERHAGRAELVIVSDFQIGSIDSATLGGVAPDLGVRLLRVPVAPLGARETSLLAEGVPVIARSTPTAGGVDVEWRTATGIQWSDAPVLVLSSTAGRPGVAASESAAWIVGVRLPFDSARRVAIVLPRFERRAELLEAAKPLDSLWMFNVVSRVAGDPALGEFAHGIVEGHDRLLLFSSADAATPALASLVAAVRRAVSVAPPVTELEPAVFGDSVLQAWERTAPSAGARSFGDASTGMSDARWGWMAVLLLLLLESWMRRADRVAPPAAEVVENRAA